MRRATAEPLFGSTEAEVVEIATCVSAAPEVYQRKQHELLEGLEGEKPIADDILIVGCDGSEEEAGKNYHAKLIPLLGRSRQVKMWLTVKKKFPCRILSGAGLKADAEKVRTVLDMPASPNVEGIERLIRLVTYLGALRETL